MAKNKRVWGIKTMMDRFEKQMLDNWITREPEVEDGCECEESELVDCSATGRKKIEGEHCDGFYNRSENSCCFCGKENEWWEEAQK